ncbi:hypothetical protein TWF696_000983 [Orbilia brochopaga]|uniref:Uncharacterized protein n=1 Tax=Orbilia brochopaga TaxID=3140254 RepID=A0AAV9VCY3_9PEZI
MSSTNIEDQYRYVYRYDTPEIYESGICYSYLRPLYQPHPRYSVRPECAMPSILSDSPGEIPFELFKDQQSRIYHDCEMHKSYQINLKIHTEKPMGGSTQQSPADRTPGAN